MIVEKLKIEELSQVLELHKDIIPFAISFDKAFEMYNEMLLDDNYFVAVAKEEEEVIGSAIGICCKTLTVPFLIIEDVVVKEGLRGKGIGKKIMESLDSFAERKKCAYAILVSSDFRKKAHKFYENHGFTDSVRGFRKVY
ncbi:GNAT family N-acetyltransferase [Clostridium sp. BL-8]|uniref:GNAT family N-acetyltransferase n=1 Tax=Clostridium sp. BL-8 TaxID=349938 RepID=UPI00098CCB5D|nr:GNAT family N-acetyltransferase [Clostridium sp. BL-8]OOM78284.1 acetyltransferase (GNAT) family protein [Clostridium sp. BL-8]